MIEPANADLSIGKQCKLLSISRSSFYYEPKGETAMNLMLNLARQQDRKAFTDWERPSGGDEASSAHPSPAPVANVAPESNDTA